MITHGPVSRRVRWRGFCLVTLGAWMCIGTASAGTWQAVGVGDCPGRDVSGSRGSAPEAGKCDASFAGFTAVCWGHGCTYKNVPTGACTGGANPGQMYTCAATASAPTPAGGGWQSVGLGDCPGRDVAGTSGPNPDASKCNASFAGNTAVCWTTGCTYKNVATASCTGGANPGQMYTCGARPATVPTPPPPPPSAGGSWQSVGLGDCPGRDVAGTGGPNPDPSKCNPGFAGNTAVCWTTGCTYKNVATSACTGGASPGQMYTCGATPAPTPPVVPAAAPNANHRKRGPGAPPASIWQPVGVGDCPGRDVAGSAGPTPDPSKCEGGFVGNTAVCWASGCTYKNVATVACSGGANPGQMYTCAGGSAMPPPPAGPPKIQGKRYAVVNYTGDTQSPHDFVVDWKGCKVAELNPDYEHGNEDISVLVCRPGTRLVIKTEVKSTGQWIQYDWVMLDLGATMAGSYRDATTCGPSAGKVGKGGR
jgi:hypothetical protein